MDTVKGKITLSQYAHLACSHNIMDNMCTIAIAKKPYNSDDYKAAKLVVEEWSELSKHLAEIKSVALQMSEHANKTQFGDGIVLPQNLTKILSEKTMACLNLFTAPTKNTYVTLAIRPYVIDKESNYKMTRDGVTLNYQELSTLADARFQVHHLIQEMISSTRLVQLASPEDVERERIHLMSFLSLAQPGQKLRLIIEKKPPAESPAAPLNCAVPPPPPPPSHYGGATAAVTGITATQPNVKGEVPVVSIQPPSPYPNAPK